jgi:hypothetical protein
MICVELAGNERYASGTEASTTVEGKDGFR